MKQFYSIALLISLITGCTNTYAQEIRNWSSPMYVYLNDGSKQVYFCDEIDRMLCSRIGIDGKENPHFVVQDITTYGEYGEESHKIPLADIDSIYFVPSEASAFNLPKIIKQRSDYAYHSNFGWPASMLFMDSRTADIVAPTSGYNWFASALDYKDRTATSQATILMWNTNYNMINSCNLVLRAIDPDTSNLPLQFCMAQALGYRAWAYFNLAQAYQFTYIGNQDKPCVPIITEINSDKLSSPGIPRATVEEVYSQILEDLNKCIDFLKNNGHIKPVDRYGKQFFTISSAVGLRARINLVMNNWKDAKEDAKYVIDNSGCIPYSIADVSHPSFWDASDSSWLLASCIDYGEVGNLHCWPAHFVTFYTGGYAQVGILRKINKALFETIPVTDVRKGWWCDADGNSSNIDAPHAEVLYSYFNNPKEAAYVNVKFDTDQSMPVGMEYSNDIPLMRIEEMYYILAEATAMSGEDGSPILNNFVKTYRDPDYNFSGNGMEVQEECWKQRRIEFWGEGISYYDLQRLKKPVDRVGGGFETSVCFQIPADSPLRIYMIPESALASNPGIVENNVEGEAPMPIEEK